MRRSASAIASLVAACGAGTAQQAPVKPSFDVASVKVSLNQAPTGGPGTQEDPGRVTYGKITLHDLLFRAFDLHFEYQVSGPEWLFAPWLDSTKLEVMTTFPPGTGKEEFRIMLQSMLEERFHLKFHHEMKARSVYDLVVTASGLKLKESATKARIIDGNEVMPPTVAGCTAQGPRGSGVPMSLIASQLAHEVGTTVNDKTGLTGRYDYEAESLDAGALPVPGQMNCPLAPALESFGLRLEKRNGSIDVLVIDHLDREPTAN